MIPTDEAIQELDLPGKPHAVVADPSGGVWVSLWGADQVARITADGEVSTIDLIANGEPHGLAIETTARILMRFVIRGASVPRSA